MVALATRELIGFHTMKILGLGQPLASYLFVALLGGFAEIVGDLKNVFYLDLIGCFLLAIALIGIGLTRGSSS